MINTLDIKRIICLAFLILNSVIGFSFFNPVWSIETIAREAILIDMETKVSLLEKNADNPMPPASMSKLMTLYLLFSRLNEGSLKLDDSFAVSERAWKLGGVKSGSSTMFLKPGSKVKVEDLIRGIVVQSGNDACIVVAENLFGSETHFAEKMTAKGRDIGLLNSTFKNSTGWPNLDHRMTSRDLATLSQKIISDFPQYYHYFKEVEFTYNGIKQFNRNPLLYNNFDVDGLKTGYTTEAGYGLVASAKRGDRRLILVVNGLLSKKSRKEEPQRLFDWGFQEFNNYLLFKAEETVTSADVWLGKSVSLPLIIKKQLKLTLSRQVRAKMKVIVSFDSPIPAPIKKGEPVAKLKVFIPGQKLLELDLVAGASIEELSLFGRLLAAFKSIVWGFPG